MEHDKNRHMSKESTVYNLKLNEKLTIEKCLKDFRGNIQVSAKNLGLSRATLYRKLVDHNISIRKIRGL